MACHQKLALTVRILLEIDFMLLWNLRLRKRIVILGEPLKSLQTAIGPEANSCSLLLDRVRILLAQILHVITISYLTARGLLTALMHRVANTRVYLIIILSSSTNS